MSDAPPRLPSQGVRFDAQGISQCVRCVLIFNLLPCFTNNQLKNKICKRRNIPEKNSHKHQICRQVCSPAEMSLKYHAKLRNELMFFCYSSARLFGNLFAGAIGCRVIASLTSLPSPIDVKHIAQTGHPAILAISGLK
jgi:hypothetical protein